MPSNKNNTPVAAVEEIVAPVVIEQAEETTTEQAEEVTPELASIEASWTIGDPAEGVAKLRTETRPTQEIHVPTLQAIAELVPDGATPQEVAMLLANHPEYQAEFIPLYHDLVAGNLLSINLEDGNGSKKARPQAQAMREHATYAAYLPEDALTYVDGDRKYFRLWPYAGNAVGVLLVGLSDPKNAWTPTLAAMATVLIGSFTEGGNFKSSLTVVEPGVKITTGRGKKKGTAAPKGNGFGIGLLTKMKLASLSK